MSTPPIPVLFAGTTFVLGGAERIFSHLVRGLDRDPFRVEVLALREPGPIGEELAANGLKVHSGLTGQGRVDPFLIHRIRRRLRRGRYRVIYFLDHAHAVFYGTVASWRTDVRVRLMPVHTTGHWDGRPTIRRPIRIVRPALNRIIAIADAQKKYLVEEEGVPEQQITVIPNGIPLQTAGEEERADLRRSVRQEFGVADETPVVGVTAVLRPEKNHELLLKAMVQVRSSFPDAELWIIGDGPRRAFLEETAAHLGLLNSDGGAGSGSGLCPRDGLLPDEGRHSDRDRSPGGNAVRFLGRRADARRIMAGLDVAALSSHTEAQPLALLESMDAGLPVAATRVGALHEMVEDGASGLLVPPDDPRSMAAALITLLADPDRRARYGGRGRSIVHDRFSVGTMVDSTADLILGLL